MLANFGTNTVRVCYSCKIAGLYQLGNTPAAIVVTQMRTTFLNLRFGILVSTVIQLLAKSVLSYLT
jgi:hypothetical protein